jgi:site-specific DNA-methyltransferase (adenine-specific)
MIDLIQLHHGDCLEIMKSIPDGSVDMILTDPPYGTTACKWDTVIPFEPMWGQVWRVLKPNGACLLFGSEPFSSALRMSQIKQFKYDWIWDKVNPSGFQLAKKIPMKQHENVSVFYRKTSLYNPMLVKKEKPRLTKHYGKSSESNPLKYISTENHLVTHSYPKSIVSISNANRKNKVHPTQKPVLLLEYFIKTYTLESETVLDFTMGSGSTGVACVNLNRNFIGIEKDDKYFEIATKRIHESK